MGIMISAIFLGIAFLGFAISAGFLTHSTVQITKIPGYSSNTDLASAHRYGTIGSIVAWITIAFMVIGFILLLIFGAEVLVGFGTEILYFLLFISLLGVITTGILAALVASDINKAKVSDNMGSYRSAIISAVIAIPVFVFLLIAIGVKLFYKPKKKVAPVDKEIQDLKIELGENPPNLKEE
jgi:hypothetical protein